LSIDPKRAASNANQFAFNIEEVFANANLGEKTEESCNSLASQHLFAVTTSRWHQEEITLCLSQKQELTLGNWKFCQFCLPTRQ
jgi:hypothetical protein